MRKNKTIYLAPLGLVGITILTGAFLISSDSFATDNTDVVDEINITVPISCSLEGTGMTSHNANIVNGTYQADIGSTTLKVFCNDDEGFAIYANGYTGDTLGNNKLIGSSTSSEIVTGTATTAGSPDVSNWAMKLETSSSATYALTLDNGFGSYSSVPSSYTKVAHRGSGTDLGTSAEGATLTSTYAAYISKTQTADTYSGQVIYTLVHPSSSLAPFVPHEIACPSGTICYHPNADITDTMADYSLTQEEKIDWSSCMNTDYSTYCVKSNPSTHDSYRVDIATLPIMDYYESSLWASNYQRPNYGFAGWNTSYDYSGENYGPNELIQIPESTVAESGVSLYAIWVKSTGALQDFTAEQCAAMAINQVTALTDIRDNNTYAVAKLADSKCWMIENMRIADEYIENNNIKTTTLSLSDTNNPSLPLNNAWYFKNAQTVLVTSNHLSAPINTVQTDWCSDSRASCVDQSMLSTSNTTEAPIVVDSVNESTENVYSFGNIYNWYSATAGNGTYEMSSGDVAGDICPINWRLPTTDYASQSLSTDYCGLVRALGGSCNNQNSASSSSNKLLKYPTNNLFGSYWSASAKYEDYAFVMNISRNKYASALVDYKYRGHSVRCLIDD